jgi:hypothetical protein
MKHIHFFRRSGVVAAVAALAAIWTMPSAALTDPLTVAATPSEAVARDGSYISWVEHIIDAQDVNGGEPIRGGDGLVMVDLDRDGRLDIVSVHEDSNHLRAAFATQTPDKWVLRTIAQGPIVQAIEDVAAGDLNGDGWPDLVIAAEEAHLAYFQNPGVNARTAQWQSLIPDFAKGRGSWLRVSIADINGDGKPDLTAANKGAPDLIRPEAGDPDNSPTSLITWSGPPLDPASWHEQVLYSTGVPNTALPVDFDGDGDMDVLAAQRIQQKMVLVENLGKAPDGSLKIREWPITIAPSFSAPADWRGLSNAFQAEFADLNRDGRIDLVVNVLERSKSHSELQAGLGWLQQPAKPDAAWIYHRIGGTLPDWVIGIHLADIDGDGDLDAVTGGYSGLNIIEGAYSGASRDFDDPTVDAASSVGRIAWFENPGDPEQNWKRHDITRQVRGMNDMFVSRDMDGDGDIDLVTTRGNSGAFDGVVWLEQVRTKKTRPAYRAARRKESRHLPLPPDDWFVRYKHATSFIAPNKTKTH